MWLNPQFSADLVTFTGEIIDGKFHFLCGVFSEKDPKYRKIRTFSINVNKSARNSGFGHIYWRNS